MEEAVRPNVNLTVDQRSQPDTCIVLVQIKSRVEMSLKDTSLHEHKMEELSAVTFGSIGETYRTVLNSSLNTAAVVNHLETLKTACFAPTAVI